MGMNRYSMDTTSTAFSHRGSLTHSSSLYYKKLNSGDSHVVGGPATTTSGSRTNPVASGGPSTPGLRFLASSPKRNDVEGNRCGNVMRALAYWWLNGLHPCPGDESGWDRRGLDYRDLNMTLLETRTFHKPLRFLLFL